MANDDKDRPNPAGIVALTKPGELTRPMIARDLDKAGKGQLVYVGRDGEVRDGCRGDRPVLPLRPACHGDLHAHVSDRSGDSVIVEGDAVLRKNGRYQVGTNFRQSERPDGIDAYGPGQSCERFAIAGAMLAADQPLSVARIRQVLAAVHVEGRPTGRPQTVYSTIYDLERRVVYVYSFHDFEHEVVIDLAAELKNGPRAVDLPSLFPRTFTREAFVAEKEAEREQRRHPRSASLVSRRSSKRSSHSVS